MGLYLDKCQDKVKQLEKELAELHRERNYWRAMYIVSTALTVIIFTIDKFLNH